MEAEIGESLGVTVEGVGDAEGLADLVGGFVEPQILMDHAEHEQVVLERGDSVEPPGGVGESLDELGFSGAFGLVFRCEAAEVSVVGVVILVGHDDDMAGESVAEGVERGALLTFGSYGAGGILRVTAIDFGSVWLFG